MPAEDREAHDNFCAALSGSLDPEGALEIQLAQSIAEDNWRMNRARAIETNMFALGVLDPAIQAAQLSGNDQIDAAINAAQVFAADPKKFQLLSLYMQRTNRDMQKNLDRLAALQTERKAQRQQALEEAAALYQYNVIKRLPNTEPQATTSCGEAASGQALSPRQEGRSTEAVASGFVFSTAELQRPPEPQTPPDRNPQPRKSPEQPSNQPPPPPEIP